MEAEAKIGEEARTDPEVRTDPKGRGWPAAVDAPPESVWPVLGALRFALALVVFGDHMIGVVGLPQWALRLGNVGAYAAVLAFFVVSGYSMAHSLRYGPRGFYGRRIDRIYPLYFFSMVVAAVPFLIHGQTVETDMNSYQAPDSVWPYVGTFFFLQTILFPPLVMNQPVWSLSLEVTYYALAPLFARAGSRTLAVLVGLSALLYVFQVPLGAGNLAVPTDHLSFVFVLWAWLGGFLFYRHRESLRAQIALLLVGVGMLCFYDDTPGHFSALVLASSLVLIGQVHTLRAWPARWLRLGDYLGNLSYPLYILHMPFFILFGSLWLGHGFLVCLAVLGAVVLSYHLVDAPWQRYARRRRAPSARQERSLGTAVGVSPLLSDAAVAASRGPERLPARP